jgi:hypothetical protein
MPTQDNLRTESLPFKPRAPMLVLLSDQLIRDAGIAVFELVKNAYDADENARLRIIYNETGNIPAGNRKNF